VRREKEREMQASDPQEGLPFWACLLLSVLSGITGAGCFFEWTYKSPIFGVIEPDFFLYTPILATLGFGGVGASVFLFVKGVGAANEASERMDKIDGY
jgi:hypothetical protein